MAFRDLIPWNRERDLPVRRNPEVDPFLTLHREMNRLFDDIFRGFDRSPFAFERNGDLSAAWPKLEVSETDREMTVVAEVPGLEQKDLALELANGALVIKGEKKTETEDRDRRFSERFFGRFERRIPVEDIDEDKVRAAFKNGVVTVTLPKSARAQERVRQIAINGG